MRRGLSQPGLADSGGADNADQAVRAYRCEQGGDVASTANEFRQHLWQVAQLRARMADGWRTRVTHRGAIRRIVGASVAGGEIDHLHREPVSASRNCRNRAGPKNLSQGTDLHLQVVVLDHQARPYHTNELVLPNRAIAPLYERHQQVESAASQRCVMTVNE